ncbi:hypothetical protein A2625_06730 [candidate division WOR-1 bacterium RIFCSPHIGHO2_01_FULL_53_15]|uniref:HTH lacI-type domain-containing protein n=1 Tax=candidate division WOR-1 bacterium RIFCSPHIGHO2_01_FULL_53_15 TaxID=1802564 RepID=A0A1F4Q4U4_UNCSA|nr:MAG: hypothetical protein A2625_06730 [candidate division WOR-1 bacterium RIFCSPHIGHO2_01_FULL_53_15]OGC10299.1 MAG: hypothetical protein A3D23_06735 [candidate division WOR-1 bacterium RIFCSPHIGHO2_02_FULL_53_26]
MKRKKVRIQDIAKRLGISIATVSLAYNHPNLVNRKTRQEILSLCEELGYVKPIRGKKRTRQIAVISRDTYNFANDFYAKVCEGLLIHALKHKYTLIFEPWPDEQGEMPWSISNNKVDGVIFLGSIHREKALLVKQRQLPLVLCGHPLSDLELHTVIPDGRSGIFQATKHLIELGHQRIAKITGGKNGNMVARERVEGFQAALIDANHEIREEYIVYADFTLYTQVEAGLDQLLALKEPPTAIVCASDPIAYKTYEFLLQKGYKVPQDISLTGFDNFLPAEYARGFLPKLTSVEVNTNELAKYTLEILFDLMEEPSKIALRYTLPVKLAVGETTGKPKQ